MDRQQPRPGGALKHAHLPPRRPPCHDRCTAYQPEWMARRDRTMAIACGCVNVAAGEAIPFTDGCDTGDAVRLVTPGIYYAACTLHMPAGQSTPVQLQLVLDGCPLPEGCLRVDGGGQNGFAQAMFEVERPAQLQLIFS